MNDSSSESEPTAPAQGWRTSPTQPAELQRPQIWVLEDSPQHALAIQGALGPLLDVTLFFDSPSLIEEMTCEHPDVLILDWNVPEISGIDVLRHVRKTHDEVTLPVLMLTGFRTEGDDLLNALDAGANDFATKPFALAELRARVSTLLRIRRLHMRAKRAEASLALALVREAQARERAEVQRQSLHELFMRAPVGICLLQGKDQVFEFANAEYCQIVGRTDLAGRSIREAMPEMAGQGLVEQLDRVFATGKRYEGREVSVRLSRHDDPTAREAYFDFIYQPMSTTPGVVDGIMVLVTEVTSRIRARLDAEKAARERERVAELVAAERNLLTAVLEHTPVGILVVDPHGAALLTNHRTAAELKHAPPKTEGAHDFHKWPILKDDGSPLEIENYPATQALRGQQAHAKDMGYRFGDGTIGTLQVSYGPVRSDDGAVQAGVVVFQDVTAQRAAALQARKHADFEKQLIGIVSHDLRTPLNAISLGAGLLAKDATLTQRQSKLVDGVVSAAGRASRMITDLLDFTAVRLGGGLSVKLERMELHDLTRRVISEIVMASAQERQVDFVQTGDATGMWDADRMAQLIVNLTMNALYYSPKNSVVRIETHGGAQDVTLMVKNEGPPIPPELLPRLFLPMQRGINQAEPSRRSVGLGLFIVDQIVSAHRGTIDVHSTAGEGTTFTVRFPKEVRG